MRNLHFIDGAILAVAAALLIGSAHNAEAGFKCDLVNGKLVCGKKSSGQSKTNDDEKADEGEGKPQDNKKQFTCKKAKCGPGETKLQKPNKYGACCEPKGGLCPPDRPSGTPPNCCPEGTTSREGACWPTNCPPGTVGMPPHCQRTCGPDKVLVGQTCYDPCPAGTTGTPPNCSPSVPPAGGTKPYCITCGGPGCLQKAPACPSGGLTTCTDVPGKTYYNCCCP